MGIFSRFKSNTNNSKLETTTTMPTTTVDSSDIPRRRHTPQPVELGTIDYVNLSPDGRHGDFETAIRIARETGKPIFANFVEWSG